MYIYYAQGQVLFAGRDAVVPKGRISSLSDFWRVFPVALTVWGNQVIYYMWLVFLLISSFFAP